MSGTELPTQLTADDVGALLGFQGSTWRAYVTRGKAPGPAGYLGRTPWWTPAQVEKWKSERPGQGAGGGRPYGFSPKKATPDPVSA